MPYSQFSYVPQQNIMDTYAPIPWDAIAKAGVARQTLYNTVDDSLADLQTKFYHDAIAGGDEKLRQANWEAFNNDLDANIESVGGDKSKLSSYARKKSKELFEYLNYKDGAHEQTNYNTKGAWEAEVDATKLGSEDKSAVKTMTLDRYYNVLGGVKNPTTGEYNPYPIFDVQDDMEWQKKTDEIVKGFESNKDPGGMYSILGGEFYERMTKEVAPEDAIKVYSKDYLLSDNAFKSFYKQQADIDLYKAGGLNPNTDQIKSVIGEKLYSIQNAASFLYNNTGIGDTRKVKVKEVGADGKKKTVEKTYSDIIYERSTSLIKSVQEDMKKLDTAINPATGELFTEEEKSQMLSNYIKEIAPELEAERISLDMANKYGFGKTTASAVSSPGFNTRLKYSLENNTISTATPIVTPDQADPDGFMQGIVTGGYNVWQLERKKENAAYGLDVELGKVRDELGIVPFPSDLVGKYDGLPEFVDMKNPNDVQMLKDRTYQNNPFNPVQRKKEEDAIIAHYSEKQGFVDMADAAITNSGLFTSDEIRSMPANEKIGAFLAYATPDQKRALLGTTPSDDETLDIQFGSKFGKTITDYNEIVRNKEIETQANAIFNRDYGTEFNNRENKIDAKILNTPVITDSNGKTLNNKKIIDDLTKLSIQHGENSKEVDAYLKSLDIYGSNNLKTYRGIKGVLDEKIKLERDKADKLSGILGDFDNAVVRGNILIDNIIVMDGQTVNDKMTTDLNKSIREGAAGDLWNGVSGFTLNGSFGATRTNTKTLGEIKDEIKAKYGKNIKTTYVGHTGDPEFGTNAAGQVVITWDEQMPLSDSKVQKSLTMFVNTGEITVNNASYDKKTGKLINSGSTSLNDVITGIKPGSQEDKVNRVVNYITSLENSSLSKTVKMPNGSTLTIEPSTYVNRNSQSQQGTTSFVSDQNRRIDLTINGAKTTMYLGNSARLDIPLLLQVGEILEETDSRFKQTR